jgi:purine-binding chemotaxis protein CheW
MADKTEYNGLQSLNVNVDNQFVTFNIEDEIYGVDVKKVHEIIGMTKITKVPNSMVFMKGMIDLRGRVVPVVDMRLKFNMEEKEYNEMTVILIVEVMGKLIGMVVDTVSDVIGLKEENIQDTPHFSTKIDTDYISGIGRSDEKLIILLEVDKILTSEEIEKIEMSEEMSG